jgi:ankyrin repeat protein
MIRGSQSLIETPWAPEEFYKLTRVIYKWLEENDHCAVFRQLISTAQLDAVGRIRLICCHARLSHLNYINILIDLVLDEKELSYGLSYAAKYKGRTALQAAAEGGHLEVVQRLLEAKADVNAAGSDGGRTALQAAAGGGHLEVVQRLLEAKADVNAAAGTYFGRTALEAAAEGGHLQIVALLKSSGASR